MTLCYGVAFIEQYRHFSAWAYGVRRLPYSGEFFKVCGYIVQKLDNNYNAYGLKCIHQNLSKVPAPEGLSEDSMKIWHQIEQSNKV